MPLKFVFGKSKIYLTSSPPGSPLCVASRSAIFTTNCFFLAESFSGVVYSGPGVVVHNARSHFEFPGVIRRKKARQIWRLRNRDFDEQRKCALPLMGEFPLPVPKRGVRDQYLAGNP